MKLSLPTVEFIEEIHKAVIETYGGKDGTLHKGVLETIIARPKHYVSYDDSNLHKICAVVVHTIAQDHPFTDANKRTALLTVIFVYRINGVHLNVGALDANGEFTTLLLWIVQNDPSINDIAIQLQEIVESYAKSGLERAIERIVDFF